jgi:hypothetical protein
MFTSKEEIINNQISVESKNNIDMQENWVKFSLAKPYERVTCLKSIKNLRIDDLSNRLKKMRNAMMKSRYT